MAKTKKVLGFYNESGLLLAVGVEDPSKKPGYYYNGCTHRIGAPRVELYKTVINKFLDHTKNKNRIWAKNIDMFLYVTKDLQIPSNIRLQFRGMVESKNVHFGELELNASDEIINKENSEGNNE